MASKPKDNRPAMEHGEVKVIKNERQVDPGKTPGSAEAGVQREEPVPDAAGETPGSAESGAQ
jgi:hypothetical protein